MLSSHLHLHPIALIGDASRVLDWRDCHPHEREGLSQDDVPDRAIAALAEVLLYVDSPPHDLFVVLDEVEDRDSSLVLHEEIPAAVFANSAEDHELLAS